MSSTNGGYYLPQPSFWPLVGSLGLFLTFGGFALALPVKQGDPMGSLMLTYIGLGVLAFMMFGWFGKVVVESEAGSYNAQVDRSFRMGMGWFIFSEVMFFAAFFGALYYIRLHILPHISGAEWPFGATAENKALFEHAGKVLEHGKELGKNQYISMGWNGIPMYNTIILLTSGVTLTLGHHALKKGNRGGLIMWLAVTVALGALFLGLQGYEYGHAWKELHLRFGDSRMAPSADHFGAGTYASTFYMLTGFHGFHVFVGASILLILLLRSMKGHFTPKHHFAFEAGAWYWHFVDVVWLGLYVFVYALS